MPRDSKGSGKGAKKGAKKASSVPKKARTGAKLKSMERSKKCGWARYFETSRELFEALCALRELKNQPNVAVHIPKHISDSYVSLVVKYNSDQRECSVCLEPVTFDTAKLTDCGHLFHTVCIEKLPTCPLCRGKFAPKALEQAAAAAAAASSAAAVPSPVPNGVAIAAAPASAVAAASSDGRM